MSMMERTLSIDQRTKLGMIRRVQSLTMRGKSEWKSQKLKEKSKSDGVQMELKSSTNNEEPKHWKSQERISRIQLRKFAFDLLQ